VDDAPVPLDGVDRRLLDALVTDARTSVHALAARANVSRSTAYQRLNRLQESGVIRRFTVDLDARRLGLPIAALVLANVDQHSWRSAADRVRQLPGVEWIGITTGPSDFVVLVRAPDVDHLRDVVLTGFQAIPEIRSTQSLFLLDEMSSEGGRLGALPD